MALAYARYRQIMRAGASLSFSSFLPSSYVHLVSSFLYFCAKNGVMNGVEVGTPGLRLCSEAGI